MYMFEIMNASVGHSSSCQNLMTLRLPRLSGHHAICRGVSLSTRGTINHAFYDSIFTFLHSISEQVEMNLLLRVSAYASFHLLPSVTLL